MIWTLIFSFGFQPKSNKTGQGESKRIQEPLVTEATGIRKHVFGLSFDQPSLDLTPC